ncbi:MAG: copper homeostasis protein CutC, partial [Planctomycetaceae bacterium]
GAIAAQNGGAHRVELNSALTLGGITPSTGLVQAVVESLEIPVIAMLRPRESGFCYSRNEFDVMRRDLDLLLQAGVHGIAFGFLKENATVDVQRCETIIRQMGDREPVFHRAFDVVPEPLAALSELRSVGVRRVMTSGQAPTAMDGVETIQALVEAAGTDIEILAAGGVRTHNVVELVRNTGVQHVHAAMLTEVTDRSMGTNVSFSAARKDSEQSYSTTDEARVKDFVQATLQ